MGANMASQSDCSPERHAAHESQSVFTHVCRGSVEHGHANNGRWAKHSTVCEDATLNTVRELAG